MDTSNVSRRMKSARALGEISARELDRLAHKAPGTAAILEGRDQENTRKETAEAYAPVLGLNPKWVMVGASPCLAPFGDMSPEDAAALVQLDADRAADLPSIAAHIKLAIERARRRTLRSGSPPADGLTIDRNAEFDQRTGTEG